jgi:hypothetical protein
MNNVTTVGTTYTLSFWIYAKRKSTVTVAGSTFNVTTKWTKHSHVFTADSTDLIWVFGSTGTYYLYHSQLEIGNKITDWRPNPDDVDQNISEATSEVREEIIDQTTSMVSDKEKILLSAIESKVSLDEYGAFKETATTKADLELKASEISMNFTTQITDLDNTTTSKFREIDKYISFSSDGIIISAGENSMKLRLDNNIIMFEKNGVQLGSWDGTNFYSGNIIINVEQRAQFGNYAFVPRTDGSLSFLKVANNTGFYATCVGSILNIYGAHPTLSDTTLHINDIPAVLSETTLNLGG